MILWKYFDCLFYFMKIFEKFLMVPILEVPILQGNWGAVLSDILVPL